MSSRVLQLNTHTHKAEVLVLGPNHVFHSVSCTETTQQSERNLSVCHSPDTDREEELSGSRTNHAPVLLALLLSTQAEQQHPASRLSLSRPSVHPAVLLNSEAPPDTMNFIIVITFLCDKVTSHQPMREENRLSLVPSSLCSPQL